MQNTEQSANSKLQNLALLAAVIAIAVLYIVYTSNTDSGFGSEDTVRITILQLNDVYEMDLVHNGRYGSLARVKTILNQLESENPNTLAVLAGDVFSPSALGNAVINGERLAGKQIINVLNYVGLDYMTFGNHEFDLDRTSFVKRLSETKFDIICSNIQDRETGEPFEDTIGEPIVLNFDGLKLGLAGICMKIRYSTDINNPEKYYFVVGEPMVAAKNAVDKLKTQMDADVVVLLTHQSIEDDTNLAKSVDDIDLIIGGHEHENFYARRGRNLTPIAKADANSRTAYIHDIIYNRKTGKVEVKSRLQLITDSIEPDPIVQSKVDDWTATAKAALKEKNGIDPDAIIFTPTELLDGTEATIRNRGGRLTDLVAEAFYEQYPTADAALFNGSLIRIDETLEPDVGVSGYTIMRISPFGGDICLVTMPGSTLTKALNTIEKSKGSGAYLHYSNIAKEQDDWKIGGNVIDPDKYYKIALPFYLVKVGDFGLGFLTLNYQGANGAEIPTVSLVSSARKYEVIPTIANKLKATYAIE